MILGKVAEWVDKLEMGEAVILTTDDIYDSARYNLDSELDWPRREDALKVVAEINSDEYPNYKMLERPDGRWTLDRRNY
jgi:hypothetical protein